MDRHSGKRVPIGVAGEGPGVAREGYVQHFPDHDDSLDDSAFPIRSVDGAYLEGVSAVVIGKHRGSDDGAAIWFSNHRAVADFDFIVCSVWVLHDYGEASRD